MIDLRIGLFNVVATHASIFSKATIVSNYQELANLAPILTFTFMLSNAQSLDQITKLSAYLRIILEQHKLILNGV